MVKRSIPVVVFVLLLPLALKCQQAATELSIPNDGNVHDYQLPAAILASPEKLWSIKMRLSPLKELPVAPLLLITDASKKTRLEAHIVSDADGKRIEFLAYSDFNERPLSLALPLNVIDTVKPHTFLLRYRGSAMDLFCDGVLADQEWPVGTIVGSDVASAAARFPLTQIGISGTAISDEQISTDNGGLAEIDKRADAMFGTDSQDVQYGRPRGWNTNAGDAMPFFHDGVFHLFFLLDRRQHRSKWGLGAHQWGHISSTDLVHWKHFEQALTIEHEWEGSICTGSVFFHQGRYYAFYATRMPDRRERLGVAESQDGVHFKKIQPTPFAEPAPPYIHGPNRDPFVFQMGGQFHMLVTAAVAGQQGMARQGALEHLVSDDLTSWKVLTSPFLVPGYAADPECSTIFRWKGWYYLTFGIDGATHYRMARTPQGPWITPEVDTLDGPEALVMKSAAFKNDRRIIVGFLPHDNRFGGNLVFRELIQRRNGTLGTKVPQEMEVGSLRIGTPSKLRLDTAHPSFTTEGDGPRVRIAAKFTFSGSNGSFGIELGTGEKDLGGERLVVDPAAKRIMWFTPNGETQRAKIESVEASTGSYTVDLTLYDTIADVTINKQRTMVHRLSKTNNHRVTFFTKGPDVKVSNIERSSTE